MLALGSVALNARTKRSRSGMPNTSEGFVFGSARTAAQRAMPKSGVITCFRMLATGTGQSWPSTVTTALEKQTS